MAEAKVAQGSTTLLNRGQRTFDLGLGADKKARRHAPGTLFTYSAEEAARSLKLYPKELIETDKLPGAVDNRALKAELAKLKAENEALKAALPKEAPKKDEKPKDPK